MRRFGAPFWVLTGLLAVVAIGGLAYATIPGSDGVITTCFKKKSGRLRVIDPDKRHCKGSERTLTFNQRGETGPRGQRGASGSAGKDAGTIVDGGNCADIQHAIDALPGGGGAVIVRGGTYACSAPIVIDRNNVSLRGSGGGTVLRLANHANRPVLILGQTTATPSVTRRNIDVADLAIDGNRAQQDFECSNGPCSGSDYLRNNGISVRRVEDAAVEHVSVRNAKSGGLVAELGSRRLTVRDFTTSGSEFDGLAAYQTQDSLFTGLNLHDNDGAGLSFDIDFNNNVISDSVLAANGDVGIFMRDSSDNLFTDVAIRDSGSYGAFLAQVDGDTTKPASGNTFSSMMISRSSQGPGTGDGYGMRVNDASCTDNLVVGSQFVDNPDGDISEPSPGLVERSAVITR